MIGEDGFTYYTCKGECSETKIAALFLPAEIASGELICRACSGEIERRPVHGPRPPQSRTPAQKLNSFVNPHYVRSVPIVFKRGGFGR